MRILIKIIAIYAIYTCSSPSFQSISPNIYWSNQFLVDSTPTIYYYAIKMCTDGHDDDKTDDNDDKFHEYLIQTMRMLMVGMVVLDDCDIRTFGGDLVQIGRDRKAWSGQNSRQIETNCFCNKAKCQPWSSQSILMFQSSLKPFFLPLISTLLLSTYI